MNHGRETLIAITRSCRRCLFFIRQSIQLRGSSDRCRIRTRTVRRNLIGASRLKSRTRSHRTCLSQSLQSLTLTLSLRFLCLGHGAHRIQSGAGCARGRLTRARLGIIRTSRDGASSSGGATLSGTGRLGLIGAGRERCAGILAGRLILRQGG